MDNDKLLEAIQEIKQQLAVIDVKVSKLEQFDNKVDEINDKVIVNCSKIANIEKTIGVIIGAIITIGTGLVVAVARNMLGI